MRHGSRLAELYLSINVTAADLHDERTVTLIRNFLHDTGLNPSQLVVEATERGLIDPERSHEVVARLRGLGVRVAIDDFGTGYSGLAYLQTLDVAAIKIDRTFVDTMGTTAATSHVAHHIIEMAKALDLYVVAEGVETQEQADALRVEGVRYAQGWLYSKPLLADAFFEEFARRSGNIDPAVPSGTPN